jgi:O-antigen ligase
MENDFGNYLPFVGKKFFVYVLIALIGIFCGGSFFYIMTLSSSYDKGLIIGGMFLLGVLGIYFFYVLKSPEACIPFIICSSWLVFFEPAPTDILAAMAILAFLIRMIISGRKFIKIDFKLALLFIFLLFNLNNLITGKDDVASRVLFFVITSYLVALAFLVFQFSISFNSMRRQLALFLIPGVITSVALILSYLTNALHLDLGPLRDILMMEGRSRAFFKDPNVAGPFLILPATYCFAILLNDRGRRKSFLLMLFLLLGTAILSTLSRGAILGIIISTISVSILSLDKRTLLRILVGVSLIIGILSIIISVMPQTDIFKRIYDTKFGVEDRMTRIEKGIEAFKQNPIIGSGMELPMEEAPHDTYFLLLQQLGILGFISFWFPIILLTFRMIIKGKRSLLYLEKTILFTLVGAILAHMALATMIYLIHWRHFWYMVGLSLAAVRLTNIENVMVSEENHRQKSMKNILPNRRGGDLKAATEGIRNKSKRQNLFYEKRIKQRNE